MPVHHHCVPPYKKYAPPTHPPIPIYIPTPAPAPPHSPYFYPYPPFLPPPPRPPPSPPLSPLPTHLQGPLVPAWQGARSVRQAGGRQGGARHVRRGVHHPQATGAAAPPAVRRGAGIQRQVSGAAAWPLSWCTVGCEGCGPGKGGGGGEGAELATGLTLRRPELGPRQQQTYTYTCKRKRTHVRAYTPSLQVHDPWGPALYH